MLQNKSPAIASSFDNYWKLICKLRWIGLEDEAARIQTEALLLAKEKRGTVFAVAPDTD